MENNVFLTGPDSFTTEKKEEMQGFTIMAMFLPGL